MGLAIGYGLNQIVSKRLKTDVIVYPQLESKNYLYDVVDEVQSNIESKDTIFFKSIGLENIDFSGLEITVNRISQEGASESDMKYLELLQSFENTEAISDIVRAELENKSSFNHRISFFYKNQVSGVEFAEKVIDYINANNYFDEMLVVSVNNAISRIEQNQFLLEQVDEIIKNYTNNLASNNNTLSKERIILDNQEQVNIADLFEYKNLLIRDIEAKKIELAEKTEPVSIINFGKPQVTKKSFFGKTLVFIPLLLIGMFFTFSFVKFLNKKAESVLG
ncbi:hypothetical protein NYZ99_20205 [Maribacter litopenaei]|uniref:Polysaccharide chain length determinant N-terminal domain-containing protein n=1 Tax=Maribacter litopenaei TaxID=2976127 RepID=A0ABY5Y7J3_9FLAO|nr:hypothetical protein [Maribacter litopenaei]UWX55000.1 hypothetical protein NYZ99_20205 [Maribacter litopenaei]